MIVIVTGWSWSCRSLGMVNLIYHPSIYWNYDWGKSDEKPSNHLVLVLGPELVIVVVGVVCNLHIPIMNLDLEYLKMDRMKN